MSNFGKKTSNIYHIINLEWEKKGNLLRIPAPVLVRSCGHYTVSGDFRDVFHKRDFLELYWGVKGEAEIVHQGRVFYLKPQTAFIYLPGDFHHITAHSAELEYRLLTLIGPGLDDLIRYFHLQQKIYETDSCPENLFEELEAQLANYSERGEYLASALAYLIITQAIAGRTPQKNFFSQFRSIIQQHYADPGLTMENICALLQVHISTLIRSTQQTVGLTPYEYLVNYRVNVAMGLLLHSDQPIRDIAHATGFASANYFAKVIRKYFGMSPRALRQQGLPDLNKLPQSQ